MHDPGRRLNVLVLGVGGNVSQSIQKALALSSVPIRQVAACIGPESAGLYLGDVAYVSPLAADPTFLSWLIDLCTREAIDAVLSGSEPVLDAIAPAAASIREQTGAVCIVSAPEVLAIGRDKLHTCRWLESFGLPVPGYADCADAAAVSRLVERCGFPLIAKPRFGKGSDSIVTIRDAGALEAVAVTDRDQAADEPRRSGVRPSEMVLQELLGDNRHEYTAGSFSDRDGRVRGTIVMRRTLGAGTTVTAELGRFPGIAEVVRRIVGALAPLGPCNVQLRMRDGLAVPFEINVRFSGTTALRARMGFNDVDACLRHFVLGEPARELHAADSGVALRYWNEVYVPRDAFDAVAREGRLDQPLAHGVTVEGWGGDG